MTKHDDGGPAFPDTGFMDTGMSLRDYAQIEFMKAIIGANCVNNDVASWMSPGQVEELAHGYADAMIAERKRRAE